MEQPPGFEEPGKEDCVMRPMKSIYGMKQASRIWNQTFNTTVVGLDAITWTIFLSFSLFLQSNSYTFLDATS